MDKCWRPLAFPETIMFSSPILSSAAQGNRDPQPDEVSACIGYLRKQIELIAGFYRLFAGGRSEPYGSRFSTKQHSQFVEKDGVMMMGTFHPAALLRNQTKRPMLWMIFASYGIGFGNREPPFHKLMGWVATHSTKHHPFRYQSLIALEEDNS